MFRQILDKNSIYAIRPSFSVSVLNQKHPKRVFDFKTDQNLAIPPADIIEGSDKNLSKQINYYCSVMGTDQIVIYDGRVFAASEIGLICVGDVNASSHDSDWQKYTLVNKKAKL